MAHHKSAIKRHKQSLIRQARNIGYKTRMRSITRKFREAIDAGKLDDAKAILPEAIKVIQKTAAKGVIHRRNAARRVSRLMNNFNKTQA